MSDKPVSTRVEISGKLRAAAVRVGGNMLPCSKAVLNMDAKAIPVLTVELPVVDDIVVTLDDAYPVLAQETREALIAMGWTPPQEEPR